MTHYRNLVQHLSEHYPISEATSMARWVMEERFGLSQTDLLLDKDNNLSANDVHDLQIITQRLLKKEPLQYVLGQTTFCGLTFAVRQGVLIPRPETEELVEWITASHPNTDKTGTNINANRPRVLDIGTGSGCIALSLANRGFDVEAWDISDEALNVAQENAARLSLNVRFKKQDILHFDKEGETDSANVPCNQRYSIIVSNPPYICRKEAEEMEANVLDYEPHIALFVADNDPLLFYRAIARFALNTLSEDGELYFETNRLYANHIADMLTDMGFYEVEVRQDQFGNNRMVRAVLHPDKLKTHD